MRLLPILFFLPVVLFSQVQFDTTTVDLAFATVEETDQQVFLYAYTPWCEPCLEMEEYIFTDGEVGDFFNKNFVNLALDMDTYPGIDLAEQYMISSFPALLFLDSEGRVIHRSCGALDTSDILELARVSLSGQGTLRNLEEKYEGDEPTTDQVMNYLMTVEEACLDAEQVAQEFLNSITLSELSQPTAWEVFSVYQWDIYSREFQYVLENQSEMARAVGDFEVNGKLYDTYLDQYLEVFESEELHDFGMRALLNSIEQVSFVGSDTLTQMMRLHYAEYSANWDEYTKYAIEVVGMMDVKDADQLNEIAWNFYLHSSNQRALEIASGWIKSIIDESPAPSTIDTYASLMYKRGDTKKAIELEKYALELASELGEELTHYEYQLSKFRKK